MCGIIGRVCNSPVNQEIYDSLLLLQHRGQDATGISTLDHNTINTVKHVGQVANSYTAQDMQMLSGNIGLGHVRYTTTGNAYNIEESQPFYVNSPFGIALVHNGNITNTESLTTAMLQTEKRHINSKSDTELLLNLLASNIQNKLKSSKHFEPSIIFDAVDLLHQQVDGSYAIIAIIVGVGMLAFRDPYGIRPLILGHKPCPQGGDEWILASESLAVESARFPIQRDIAPGECVLIAQNGKMQTHTYQGPKRLCPCAFEYVYLSRPDSTINGISVYKARLNMGERLAKTVAGVIPPHEIDVVMPIPDSSRPAAMQLATKLNIPYREGFYKNRYIGRTFIMPGQKIREKSIRQKLNALPSEFEGRNVLLVDDSIVRGTTSKEIIEMAKAAGANKVYFASASPPVKYPHIYGINMRTKQELIAADKSIAEIQKIIGADALVYQTIEDLFGAITQGTDLRELDMSCFDGKYITKLHPQPSAMH